MALTFKPFSESAEYLAVNAQIVRQWVDMMVRQGTQGAAHIVDLASGAGTMIHLFLDAMPVHWRPPLVTCVDRSAEAIRLLREALGPNLGKRLECLLEAVEDLSLHPRVADVVLFGNGIHYLSPEGQQQVVSHVCRLLKPGGWFFLNTAFYAEARPAWTLPFYRKKVKLALQELGARGVPKDRKERRPPSAAFFPRDHYERLLRDNGFRIEDTREFEARLGQSAWEYISGYHEYAEGALHGYSVDAAAEALQRAVGPALQEHGRRDGLGDLYVSRNWLALAARPA